MTENQPTNAEKDAPLTMTSEQWMDALADAWDTGYCAGVDATRLGLSMADAPRNPYRIARGLSEKERGTSPLVASPWPDDEPLGEPPPWPIRAKPLAPSVTCEDLGCVNGKTIQGRKYDYNGTHEDQWAPCGRRADTCPIPPAPCPTCEHPEGYDRLSGPCPDCRGTGVIPPGERNDR